jgi:hypothetical protein
MKNRDLIRWIILKWILELLYEGSMDWIDLAPDRDQWRFLVNAVMNLRVPKKFREFLSICKTGGF